MKKKKKKKTAESFKFLEIPGTMLAQFSYIEQHVGLDFWIE